VIATVLFGAAIALHPLTPFSVDQFVEVTLHKDRVTVSAVLELGEVTTKQLMPDCAAFAAQLEARVAGDALYWTVDSQQWKLIGNQGTETGRLTCQLSAPAVVSDSAAVSVTNRYLTDRVGANQIVLAGDGVSMPESLPPAERSAQLTLQPAIVGQGIPAIAESERGWLQRAESWLARALGDSSPLVIVLAVLMAIMLGAAHAALPGHGKTVMALYMAGRQGRRRDAAIVGGTVTLTHTAGVLVLGVATSAMSGLAAESVLKSLGIGSGVLITAVGIGLLFNGLRHRHAHHHDKPHHHHDHHHHDGRRNLTVLGIAGGLVPSPTALVVLLGAAALGRLWLGVVLIIFYGLGMAATLTAAGLLLLRIRDRWAWLGRLTVPAEATGSVIILLGFGLAARAAFAF
jgi:ABC-type nickel/cobalt efflux system permease component RcnA